MLEKIKEIPLIEQSAAVKLYTAESNTLIMERNDRVIWASEKSHIKAQGICCYVEADKFFSLLPEIETVKQTTCLEVYLKNNAKYELPFLQVSWESQEAPSQYTESIIFKLDDLMLCTLKNLVKPELQCIYIDQEGAVSCDFVSACISTQVRSRQPILLPPDVQDLVNGRQCQVEIVDDKIYFETSDFRIVTAVTQPGEDRWWEQLRSMLPLAVTGTPATQLADSLRRLQIFGDYISFLDNKAFVGLNYEPFNFVSIPENKYEIEKLAKILTTAISMNESSGNLIFGNETSRFLLSPMEEA